VSERERDGRTDITNDIGRREAFPEGNYTFGCRGSDFYHYTIVQVVSINVDESSVTSRVSGRVATLAGYLYVYPRAVVPLLYASIP